MSAARSIAPPIAQSIAHAVTGSAVSANPFYTQRPPLPSTALEYWHSELGVSVVSGGVDVWTGQLQGKAMPYATNRPTYGADGSNFNARSVVQCQGNASLYSSALALFTIGQRPWSFIVFRYRSTGNLSGLCDFGITPSADSHMLAIGTGPVQLGGFINGASATPNVLSSVPLSTTVHTAQLWCVGSDANIQVDATLDTAVGAGAALAASSSAAGFGQTASGVFWQSNSSIAFVLACSALPSATERSNIATWARVYYGAP